MAALSTWTDVIVGYELVDVVDILFPAVEILLNVWLLLACQSFRLVANTDEADQAHLLSGFRRLRAYVVGQVVTIVLGIVWAFVTAALFWSAW